MSEGQQGWGLMTVGGTVRKGAAHRPGGEGCTWGAGRGQGLQAWAAGSSPPGRQGVQPGGSEALPRGKCRLRGHPVAQGWASSSAWSGASCTQLAPEGSAAARTTCRPVPRKTRWLPQPWQRGLAAGGAAACWPWQAHWRSFHPRVLACASPADIGPRLLREVVEGGGDSFGMTGPGAALQGQLGKGCRPPPRPAPAMSWLSVRTPCPQVRIPALPTSSRGRSSSPSRGRSHRRGSTRP